MVCWTRPKNLSEYLIRAKLPKEIYTSKPRREKLGFTHCKRNCMMCKHSPKCANHVISSSTKERFEIKSNLSCTSENVIFCITCKKIEAANQTHSILVRLPNEFVIDFYNTEIPSQVEISRKL